MSTEAALIAACTATPRDSLPRLVYADWLDERNDPRGEMIRVMEEMRRHPVWADEYQKLRPARNRLWKSLDTAWLETMGYQKVYRPLFGTMPEKREHRWRLAEEFIDIWHGGLKRGDGYTAEELTAAEERSGCQWPKALREWYRFGGRRADIWSNQDHFRPPDLVRFQDEYGLVFRVENQGCTRWSIRPADLKRADPPVYGGEGDRMVADSLSAFALFVLVYESQFRNIWGQLQFADEREEERLFDRFHWAHLPWQYWLPNEVRFLEANDTILMRNMDLWWYTNCRTEAAYQQLVRDFGDRVERFKPSA